MYNSNQSPAQASNERKITSLEIAEITGKRHDNVIRDIRDQEVAWEKVTALKFELSNYTDSTGQWMGFAIALAFGGIAWHLIRSGYEVGGTIIGSVDLVALVAVFITGRR